MSPQILHSLTHLFMLLIIYSTFSSFVQSLKTSSLTSSSMSYVEGWSPHASSLYIGCGSSLGSGKNSASIVVALSDPASCAMIR